MRTLEELVVVYKPSPDVILTEFENELVLLNVKTEEYYGLEHVSARMYQLLAEHGDSERVVSMLVQEYDVGEAVLRRDLQSLIGDLLGEGILLGGD